MNYNMTDIQLLNGWGDSDLHDFMIKNVKRMVADEVKTRRAISKERLQREQLITRNESHLYDKTIEYIHNQMQMGWKMKIFMSLVVGTISSYFTVHIVKSVSNIGTGAISSAVGTIGATVKIGVSVGTETMLNVFSPSNIMEGIGRTFGMVDPPRDIAIITDDISFSERISSDSKIISNVVGNVFAQLASSNIHQKDIADFIMCLYMLMFVFFSLLCFFVLSRPAQLPFLPSSGYNDNVVRQYNLRMPQQKRLM